MATTFLPQTSTVPPAVAAPHLDDPWREPVPLRQVVVGALVGVALLGASLLAWLAIAVAVLRIIG